MSKSDNLLAVLWLLSSRKRMTAAQLAEELECSVRTVYRYIDALCATGVPVVAEPGHEGGYSLLDHFMEAPLFFDEDERKSIVHAAMFAEHAGYPHKEALERALEKIKLYTNKDQLDALVRHTRGFEVLPSYAASPPLEEPLLRGLELAVAESQTVIIDYIKKNGSSTPGRSIHPYGLVHWMGKWYIVAFCQLRRDIRSFRVDRIRSILVTDELFERPHPFSAGDYFTKQLLPQRPREDELTSVKLEGNGDVLSHLCNNRNLQLFLVEQTQSKAHFKMDLASALNYLPGILFSYGRSIEVKEPVELKEKLAAQAAELALYYQSQLS